MSKYIVPILFIVGTSAYLYYGKYNDGDWAAFFRILNFGTCIYLAHKGKVRDVAYLFLRQIIYGIWGFYIVYSICLSKMTYLQFVETHKGLKMSLAVGFGIIIALLIQLIRYGVFKRKI